MKRKKITFVCTGNTCRSPMAEALLRAEIKRRKIKWWDVASCGIHAEVGGDISVNSKAVLDEIDVKLKGFKPQQLTQKQIENSTLVVTMTESQRLILEACGNIRSVKEMCGFDIPDPYGCGIEVYRMTRDALISVCNTIVENYILKFEED